MIEFIGMVDGPCGTDFREAFSCFVHSDSEPKGVDCIDSFRAMQECMGRNPEYYARDDDDEDEDEEENEKSTTEESSKVQQGEQLEKADVVDSDDNISVEESRIMTTEE